MLHLGVGRRSSGCVSQLNVSLRDADDEVVRAGPDLDDFSSGRPARRAVSSGWPGGRRGRRVLGAGLCVLGLGLGAAGCRPGEAPSSAPSRADGPSVLLARAFGDLSAAPGVEVTARVLPRRGRAVTEVTRASAAAAEQTVSWDGGSSGGESTTTLLVGRTVYLHGAAAALERMDGLPPTVAAVGARQWLAVPPGGPGYADLRSGLDQADLLAELRPPAGVHLSRLAEKSAGTVRLSWVTPGARVVVTISLGRPPRVVAETSTGPAGETILSVRRLGQTFRPPTPRSAVPLATVLSTPVTP